MSDLTEIHDEMEAKAKEAEEIKGLSSILRRITPTEAKYMLEIYEKREEAAKRIPYRDGWILECLTIHHDGKVIVASHLKLHPRQEAEKSRKKKR